MDPNMTIRPIGCFRWLQTCPFLSIRDWWAENARVVLTRARTHVLSEEDGAHEINIEKGAREAHWLEWKRHSIKPTSISRISKLQLTSFHSLSFLFPGFDWRIPHHGQEHVRREVVEETTHAYKWVVRSPKLSKSNWTAQK